jgi:hypothetical protein
MNISGDDAFHELALKAIANAATPVEHTALQTLLAQEPGLAREFEQMQQEAAAMRDLLPLLEDVQHPRASAPPIPHQRLEAEVRGLFDRPRPRLHVTQELERLLERWASRQTGVDTGRFLELVGFLRSIDSATVSELFRLVSRPRLLRSKRPPATPSPGGGLREQAQPPHGPRSVETELQLRSLANRIQQLEEAARECHEELRGLIETLTRERAIGEGANTPLPNNPPH